MIKIMLNLQKCLSLMSPRNFAYLGSLVAAITQNATHILNSKMPVKNDGKI
jgi:hypothetical protein